MRLPRPAFLLAALLLLAALTLAACGGDDDDDGATAASGGSEQVSTADIDGATVLVDSAGQSLYTSDREAGGKVACTGDCASIWMPAAAPGGEVPSVDGATLASIKRPDGARQLTFDGKPLYSFTQEGPGELTGDGFTDSFEGRDFTWSAAVVAGSLGAADDSDSGSAGGYGGY